MPQISRHGLIGALLFLIAAGFSLADELRLRATSAIYLDALETSVSLPEDVACDGQSKLVVADTGNRRLLSYDIGAEEMTPESEIRLDQLSYPIRVRIDSTGRILALDGKSHRIVRVAPNGQFQGYLELSPEEGSGPVIPRSFEIDDDDNLYVLDVSGARILVLDRDGGFQRQIAFAPEVGFLSDLTVNSSGAVFAVDSVRRQVFAARKSDEALFPLTEIMDEDMDFPTGIAADAVGHLYVADQYGGGIVIVGQDGSFQGRQSAMGWAAGFLRYPSGLCICAGDLFVADRGNNRVQRFAIVE
jgi:sugar lactone lactonase YvrE